MQKFFVHQILHNCTGFNFFQVFATDTWLQFEIMFYYICIYFCKFPKSSCFDHMHTIFKGSYTCLCTLTALKPGHKNWINLISCARLNNCMSDCELALASVGKGKVSNCIYRCEHQHKTILHWKCFFTDWYSHVQTSLIRITFYFLFAMPIYPKLRKLVFLIGEQKATDTSDILIKIYTKFTYLF